MDLPLDVTATAGPLAEAAARIARLLPARSLQPSLAAVRVAAVPPGAAARGDGPAAGGVVVLSGSDGEQSASVRVPAQVHGAGEVAVSRRGLAETLAALAAPEIRLAVEGSRLAVRTPGARFALARLDAGSLPPVAGPPPSVGVVSGAVLRAAAVPVAGAASREHALPIFTAVRIRSRGDRLSMVATDRFRMAAAAVPWRPAGPAPVDTLVPAALFAEIARQAARVDEVVVHADADRFGLAWAGGEVVTASLGTPFPDQQIDRLLDVRVECAVEAEADALAAAVDRAVPYAGPHGRVTLHAGDGVMTVLGSDPLAGESQEAVKAAVRGDHVVRTYQARYLLDALRPFAGGIVRVQIQSGLRATAFRGDADERDLSYLVVPMRTGED